MKKRIKIITLAVSVFLILCMVMGCVPESLNLKQEKIQSMYVYNRFMELEQGGLYIVSADLTEQVEIADLINFLRACLKSRSRQYFDQIYAPAASKIFVLRQ